jgi:hypothetical protein
MMNSLNKKQYMLQTEDSMTVELTDDELSSVSGGFGFADLGSFVGGVFGLGGSSSSGTPSWRNDQTSTKNLGFSNLVSPNIPMSSDLGQSANQGADATGGLNYGNVTGLVKGGDISSTIAPRVVTTMGGGTSTDATSQLSYLLGIPAQTGSGQ